MTTDEDEIIEANAESTLESFAGWVGEQMDNEAEDDTDDSADT